MFSHREDYNSPEYKSWRYAIFARDGFQCQLCMSKGRELNAHHIVRWADAPHLRYAVSNGICLCKDCHDNMVTGREEQFAPKFKEIVAQRKIQDVKKREAKFGKKSGFTPKVCRFKGKYKPRNPRLRF